MDMLSLFGRPNVERMERKRDVRGLIRALKYEGRTYMRHDFSREAEVREAAAHALGRIGDRSAVRWLMSALHDDYTAVQEAAAEALGTVGDADAAESLYELLIGWRSELFSTSAYSGIHLRAYIGIVGDVRAINRLGNVLNDDAQPIEKRARTAQALGLTASVQAVPPLALALANIGRSVYADSPIGKLRAAVLAALQRVAGQEAHTIIGDLERKWQQEKERRTKEEEERQRAYYPMLLALPITTRTWHKQLNDTWDQKRDARHDLHGIASVFAHEARTYAVVRRDKPDYIGFYHETCEAEIFRTGEQEWTYRTIWYRDDSF